MKNLLRAFIISLKAHAGQRDKAGRAYIFHPITVSLKCKGMDNRIVGLLHDVVEDSNVTLSYLSEKFPSKIVEAVDAITKRKGETYENYLDRVKVNPIARHIKLCDLEHNMDLSRLKTVTNKDLERIEKYKYARDYLTDRNSYKHTIL